MINRQCENLINDKKATCECQVKVQMLIKDGKLGYTIVPPKDTDSVCPNVSLSVDKCLKSIASNFADNMYYILVVEISCTVEYNWMNGGYDTNRKYAYKVLKSRDYDLEV